MRLKFELLWTTSQILKKLPPRYQAVQYNPPFDSTGPDFPMRFWLSAALLLLLSGCSSTPTPAPAHVEGKTICDSYIVLDMCVRDLLGDDTVDMVYFSDTMEIFMYQEGRQEAVAAVMPMHRCAVPLNPGMQATTNRILSRADMSFSDEIGITRDLITNYVAAKPTIDACNARFDDAVVEEEFFMDDADWVDS
jgi:hypothetical protein